MKPRDHEPSGDAPVSDPSEVGAECKADIVAEGLLGVFDAHNVANMPSPGTISQSSSNDANLRDLDERFPDFEILELIGRGGMGAVYKARQERLNRLVAIKILPPDVAARSGFTERFTREAEALARLNHPNIVTIYDYGVAENQYFIVMEFVDGANLAQLIKAREMRPDQALAILPQVCDALDYAHGENVVHRDIKPSNILVDRKGRVKITDFGIAKLLEDEPSNSILTGAAEQLGTPAYIAPEQRDDPLHVDHRADIYSLGVVFYEMLTGEIPSGRFEPPSKRIAVDVKLDEIVLRALDSKPELRYQHASEI